MKNERRSTCRNQTHEKSSRYSAEILTAALRLVAAGPSAAPFEMCGKEDGAPGRIRTADPLVRSQMLYPAELRVRAAVVARLST